MHATHDDIIREKKLPSVNQCVRSKKHSTIWRVIGKKKVWLKTSDDPNGLIFIKTSVHGLFWRSPMAEKLDPPK